MSGVSSDEIWEMIDRYEQQISLASQNLRLLYRLYKKLCTKERGDYLR